MNSPRLRFPEFEGEWEERRLGELLTERNVQAPKDEHYPLMAFVARKGVSPKGDRYNRGFLVKDEEAKKYKRTEIGDFIYSSNNLESGSIGANNFGPACISPVYSIFKIKENCDHDLVGNLLTRKAFIAKMIRYRQGVVYGQWRIHESDFLKISVRIPTDAEQKKIAAFLGVVDAKIAALQTRVVGLERYKRGLIQALFIGTLRFTKPDSSAFPVWEEKRLGEVATRSTAKNTKLEYMRVLTNSAVRGVVDQGDYFDKDIANADNLAGYYVLKKGDFVYNPRISTNAPVGPIKRNDLGDGVMSPLYTVFRFKEKDTEFFNVFFETTVWHKYMKAVANYGARHDRMAISSSDLMNMPLPYPTSNEQTKIAEALSAMDAKIAAVGDQVDNMEAFKKGLLQQMFV
jgi:type I restriction enzyme S subunit